MFPSWMRCSLAWLICYFVWMMSLAWLRCSLVWMRCSLKLWCTVDERISYKKSWWCCTFILQHIYLLTSALSLFCGNTHLPVPNLRGFVRLHSILVLLVCQIVARTISDLSFFLDYAILPFWSMLALFMANPQILLYWKRPAFFLSLYTVLSCTEIRNTKREAWKVL
jgi:hypothetical protein